MTAALEERPTDTAASAVTTGVTAQASGKRAERIRIWFQPIVVVVLVVAMLAWVAFGTFDEIEVVTVNFPSIGALTLQHIELSLMVVVIVVALAVPLGVAVTRRWGKPAAPLFLAIANIGQAAPSIGVLVLFYLWVYESGWSSFWIAVLPIAFYSLLPVLRNTILGIQSVEPSLIEAGTGIGMSKPKVLWRIELPLAVPFILAGLRTSLVLAVGTVTLATFVGGGGLGEMINTGYKLSRTPVLVIGAVLAMALALLIDWLGGLAERWIGPKGLR